MANEPSGAQKLIGDVNPNLAQITDDVLFGDVWERPGLSRRDRSLITVAKERWRTGSLETRSSRR
jgi:4-carboxymuconolactone decarboxylase